MRNLLLFAALAALFALTGFMQSWNLALSILTASLLSAIMALGLNIQWGYAGLFNTGLMGFTALGGLAVVLIAAQPVPEAWAAGGPQTLAGLALAAGSLTLALLAWRLLPRGAWRGLGVALILVVGFVLFRRIFDPATTAVEAVNPATDGFLGGLGLPVLWAWPLGAVLAAGAAWAIGKTALGLRSDYLAIATLGIAEIVVAVLKNEDWLARGVKNVISLPRPWPVPYEVDLQASPGFLALTTRWGLDPVTTSSILVKLIYCGLFALVLFTLIFFLERALHSPWGRMMRAIRDNEVAAAAMGKDVTRRHLQVFVFGSAIVGMAGAMLTSMHGQMTPASYNPLGFTFLIWVMVIVGGSGNNWGAVLGGLLIGWLWLIAESLGPALMHLITLPLPEGAVKAHLIEGAAHMRLLTLGLVLLLVLRFAPRGLIPEKHAG